ncbi:hypothetical protein PV326_012021, partial [Microctonus aethiopoides]
MEAECSFSEADCVFMICDRSMAGGVAHIRPHATSNMHVTYLNKIGEDMTMQDAVESDLPFDVRKNIAEIRFSVLILEKNIPHQTARDILKFFQSVGEDPNVLANMKMGRTKCSNIISNVLCPIETKRVAGKLQNTRFSIVVDETSDIMNMKWMTFLVRYIDELTLDVRTQLIKLINLDAKDCGADKLFNCFGDKDRKFLKLCETRWLSHHACIERILESWETINNFLIDNTYDAKCKSAGDLNTFRDPRFRETRIHLLRVKSVEFLNNITKNFLSSQAMLCPTLHNIDFQDHNNYRAIGDVTFEAECD